jgi:hypothetical protein
MEIHGNITPTKSYNDRLPSPIQRGVQTGRLDSRNGHDLSKQDPTLNARVHAIFSKMNRFPAWVKPACYATLTVLAGMGMMAFIGNRGSTPKPTPTQSPRSSPSPSSNSSASPTPTPSPPSSPTPSPSPSLTPSPSQMALNTHLSPTSVLSSNSLPTPPIASAAMLSPIPSSSQTPTPNPIQTRQMQWTRNVLGINLQFLEHNATSSTCAENEAPITPTSSSLSPMGCSMQPSEPSLITRCAISFISGIPPGLVVSMLHFVRQRTLAKKISRLSFPQGSIGAFLQGLAANSVLKASPWEVLTSPFPQENDLSYFTNPNNQYFFLQPMPAETK